MVSTVLVTGADKGLGFSLVKTFLQAGFQVFAGQYNEHSQLEDLLHQSQAKLHIVPLDVTDMNSVRWAVGEVLHHTSSLDILVNNAGIILDQDIVLEDLDLRIVQRTMDVNTYGPLRVTQQFFPLLEKGERKVIVNISSETGSIGDCTRKSCFGYCMSKAALNMQSKILDNYLKPKGFRILTIHPGWMQTDMGGSEADLDPEESAAGIFRLATDSETAGAALYVQYDGTALNF